MEHSYFDWSKVPTAVNRRTSYKPFETPQLVTTRFRWRLCRQVPCTHHSIYIHQNLQILCLSSLLVETLYMSNHNQMYTCMYIMFAQTISYKCMHAKPFLIVMYIILESTFKKILGCNSHILFYYFIYICKCFHKGLYNIYAVVNSNVFSVWRWYHVKY